MLEALLNSLVSSSKTPMVINGVDYAQVSYMGVDLDIAKDSKTLLIGAYSSSFYGTNSGGVLVFSYENGKYIHKQNVFPNRAGGRFGRCVKMSADGNTAVVSAAAANFNGPSSGAIYVISRANSTEDFVTSAPLYESDVGYQNAFGYTVAISDDGQYIAASTIAQTVNGISSAGAVYIYKKQDSGAYSFLNKIISPNPGNNSNFGFSLCFSKNSYDLFVGERYATVNAVEYSGKVHRFGIKNNVYAYKTTLTDPTNLGGSRFGSGLAICNNFLVISSSAGGIKINNTMYYGSIHLYKLNDQSGYDYVGTYRKPLNQITSDFYQCLSAIPEKNILYASSMKYVTSASRPATVEKFLLSDSGVIYVGEVESPNVEQTIETPGTIAVSASGTLALGVAAKNKAFVYKNV